MNKKEALIYLNAKDVNELASKIEVEVFQIKNYIFSTVFHPKLAFSKIQKLRKLYSIQINVLHSNSSSFFTDINLKLYSIESHCPKDSIQQFNHYKAQIFMKLHQANDLNEIIFHIESAIVLFLNYGRKWPLFSRNELTLSKELDPILLLKELKNLHDKGINSFDKMLSNSDLLSSEMKHESSRLNIISQDFILTHPEFVSA
jgi:hypothetical protein